MKPRMKLERFVAAGVNCVSVEPETSEKPLPLIIVLHGLGDSGESYIELGAAISTTDYRYVFPTAPVPFPGVPFGFSWFPLDLNLAQFARSVATARPLFNNLINQLLERYQTPASRTVVGGFSQGGMMALDGGLRFRSATNEKLAAIIGLSTVLPADDRTTLPELQEAMKDAASTGQPVFIAHGTNDPMLPPRLGRMGRDMLKEARVKLTYYEFLGFHEITLNELEQIKVFLKTVV